MKPLKTTLALASIALSVSAIGLTGCSKKMAESKSSVATQGAEKETYRCPMHPQVHSDQPSECPICHMALNKVKLALPEAQAAEQKLERKIKFYRNPMDPSIHSDKPMKDSMGMDYVPVYEQEGQAIPENKSEKNLGRGAFALEPERLKLTGTKEVVVEKRDLISEIRLPGRVLGGGRVSFQAFEQDASLIKSGLTFEAETPAVPGKTLNGKVTFVDSILDPMTRTLRVDGTISGTDRTPLRTESSVVGKIKAEIKDSLAIPESAVMHVGDRDLVYVSKGDGSFSPRVVSLGVKASGFYEVKSGLAVDERISSGPNFLLDSESRIEFSE